LAYHKKHSTLVKWAGIPWWKYSWDRMRHTNAYSTWYYYTIITRGVWIDIQVMMDMESLRSVTPRRTLSIGQGPTFIVNYKALPNILNPSFPIVAADIYGPTSKAKVLLRYPTAKYYEIEQSGHIPLLHNPSKFGAILDCLYSIRGCLLPSSS
jgi:hypothetical protein